jgi:DNA processing protein
MMNKSYLLALNRMNRVGPMTVAKLLKRWPNLQEMFELPFAGLVEAGLPNELAHAITTFDWCSVEADFQWESAANNHLITWADPEYPSLLREIDASPMVLYARGDLACFMQPTIAMVGTRKPSVTGGETAHYFARELSRRGISIASGLALGIDASVHQGCLDGGGRTIAVMGTGVDVIYPYRHRQLAENIIHHGGLLLSEFPLKTSPIAGHFPRRNRIISGLSLITLVVEAAIKSGSLITARLAMEQNRDVMAIPGSIHNPQARGCHHLLQQGAKLVMSIEDVLDELDFDHQSTELAKQDELVLASENENLVQCIGFEVTSIDQIVMRSGLNVSDVTIGLANLELQGFITAVTGGYMRCAHERNFI